MKEDIEREVAGTCLPAQPEEGWEGRVGWRVEQRHLNLFSIILLLASAGLAALLISWKLEERQEGREGAAPAQESTDSIGTMTSEEVLAGTKAAAEGFMKAATNAERCRWVVGGREVLERMNEFYQRPGYAPPDGLGRIIRLEAVAFHGVPMQVVLVADRSRQKVYILPVVPVGKRMLVDWEASVGYGAMSWEDFLARRPAPPTQMRVFLSRDHYYNYSVSDDSAFVSFRLEARGSSESLPAYAVRDSEAARALLAAVPEGARQPVTVMVRFLPDAEPALMIDRLIHGFWIDLARVRRLEGGSGP